MSRASNTFLETIKDAEILLAQFDAINSKPPPPHAEVLKRAGLIMALTAWESRPRKTIARATSELAATNIYLKLWQANVNRSARL